MADSSLGSKETAAPSQGGVAVLEQALWRDLTGTADEAVFASAWVGLVHRMIPGSIGGVLVLFGASPDAAPLVVNSAHGLPTDAGQLAALPQIHFVGAQDRMVDGRVARAFLSRQAADAPASIVEIEGQDHACCWAAAWPALSHRPELTRLPGWIGG